ncbi:unnamed protein product [Musa acuminata subsp. malaccensis]|uniref:(wild Malaysian banana) hypothetical protein n=1 Tax=Musa acuminata subsp. malaccensis TaxID=214687 RepID=A0A804K4L6_MUSAM|nr:PREDICTED: uncharacterized protein LOC103993425 [Musa acuminata subsp. malaccensis]CAG1831030.1 unnamed protein product [Musa acuminata subsp. malaccensis]
MDEQQEEEIFLVVEREAEMVSSSDPLIPIKRVAWFLDANPVPVEELPRYPFAPMMHVNASPVHLRESKVLFRGWGSPLRKWGEWVDKLRPIYGDLWNKSGILDAIGVSTYKIKKDYASVLGLAGVWCGETNTFLFPWGEATVTLEDTMVLGGFPVLGEPVRGSLTGELVEIEQKMVKEHRTFNRSTSKKADQSAWMKHYMEREGDELEHIAFLALWLSRFVFPGPPVKTVKQHLLPIAVRLGRGMRIALASAVLASLYRDMSAIKDYLVADDSKKTEPLVVWAPFNLLQLWVWEHFLTLRPEKQNLIANGEPRAARWHDVGRKLDLSFVGSALESSEFQWHPYMARLENWSRPSFYKDIGVWICGDASKDEELRSFAQCLRAAELVGVDCIEQYLPHRVAMQFGFDQDLPCHVPRSNAMWEAAWETYDITSKNIAFYVPAPPFKSDITQQYSIWWKQCMPYYSKLVENDTQTQGSLENIKWQSKVVAEKNMKRIQTLTSIKKRKLQEFYDAMISDHLLSGNNSVSGDDDSVESQNFQLSAAETEKQHICSMKQKEHMGLKPSNNCVGKETHDPVASQSIKSEICEATISTSLENEYKVMMEDFDQRNGWGSAYDYVVLRQPGMNITSQEAKLKLEQALEKRIMMKAEESELEMQIKVLKEEITAIEARVMDLESVAEVQS